MKQQEYELLSALIDDELGHETSSVIDGLLKDDAAKKAWGRYHLIGDSIRKCVTDRVTGIAEKVDEGVI